MAEGKPAKTTKKPAPKATKAAKPTAAKPAKAASQKAAKPAKAASTTAPKTVVASKAAPSAAAEPAANGTKAKKAALPDRVLTGLSWSLSKQRYGAAAELVSAVRAYYAELGRECSWQPDEVVLPVPSIDLEFLAVQDNGYDGAAARLNTPDPRGFTAAELLWRIHETLACYELSDKHFFEGLARDGGDERPLYRVRQGS